MALTTSLLYGTTGRYDGPGSPPAFATSGSPIRHHSYDTLGDFLRKMRGNGRLIQLGCIEGYEGRVISAYKARTVFWKYLLLHEANRRRA